jgi:hypothetical protein
MDNLEPTYLLSGASTIEQLNKMIEAYTLPEKEELKVLNLKTGFLEVPKK